MVEAAGVEPKCPHGWRGFTSTWATFGPQWATSRAKLVDKTSADFS
jgi:hypothetical protein